MMESACVLRVGELVGKSAEFCRVYPALCRVGAGKYEGNMVFSSFRVGGCVRVMSVAAILAAACGIASAQDDGGAGDRLPVVETPGGSRVMMLDDPLFVPSPDDPISRAEPIEASLRVGDVAPALGVDRWLLNGPVEGFERGTIYVVNFVASWSAPSRLMMRPLGDLAVKYEDRGVVVMSISSSVFRGENEQTMADYAKERFRLIRHIVGYDADGSMSREWMLAAGQQGLPTTFVVDGDGRIAWIGYPTALESVIEEILSGDWDSAKFYEEAEQDRLLMLRRQLVEGIVRPIMEEAAQQWVSGDREAALRTTDRALMHDPTVLWPFAVRKYRMMVHELKRPMNAAVYARNVGARVLSNNPQALNELAWAMLTDPGIEYRGELIPHELSERSNIMTSRSNPVYLRTLALAESQIERHDQAVLTIEEAIAKARESGNMEFVAELETIRETLVSRREAARVNGVSPGLVPGQG